MGSESLVCREVSAMPPMSMPISMKAEPGRMARSMLRVISLGVRRPGTETAPTTTSASAVPASSSPVVDRAGAQDARPPADRLCSPGTCSVRAPGQGPSPGSPGPERLRAAAAPTDSFADDQHPRPGDPFQRGQQDPASGQGTFPPLKGPGGDLGRQEPAMVLMGASKGPAPVLGQHTLIGETGDPPVQHRLQQCRIPGQLLVPEQDGTQGGGARTRPAGAPSP